jgi:hypothetical protein
MEHIDVTLLNGASYQNTAAEVALLMESLPLYRLSYAPWDTYPYHPDVHFSIAYQSDCIFLKYLVSEKYLRAANAITNGTVYEDSCVEFFILFDEAGYYNLEVNCIGTMLMGYGKNKTNRELLSSAVIEKIKYQVVISNNGAEDRKWEATLSIPLEVFQFHQLKSLKGQECKANFYKCGDLLPQPHFLSWSNIEAPEPNFHLPQYFGKLKFT